MIKSKLVFDLWVKKSIINSKFLTVKVFSPSNETPENHENEKTSICKIPEVNIGEDEDQLLDFEKYISEQEVSFFNPKMKISMIS